MSRWSALFIVSCLCCAPSCREGGKSNNLTQNGGEQAAKTEKCIDSSRIDRDAFCIQVYEPVCGCDGKTYGNECMARINGVLRWEKGECKE